jgi:hypothetical protein
LTIVITGAIAAILWGWVGGKSAKKTKGAAIKMPKL